MGKYWDASIFFFKFKIEKTKKKKRMFQGKREKKEIKVFLGLLLVLTGFIVIAIVSFGLIEAKQLQLTFRYENIVGKC